MKFSLPIAKFHEDVCEKGKCSATINEHSEYLVNDVFPKIISDLDEKLEISAGKKQLFSQIHTQAAAAVKKSCNSQGEKPLCNSQGEKPLCDDPQGLFEWGSCALKASTPIYQKHMKELASASQLSEAQCQKLKALENYDSVWNKTIPGYIETLPRNARARTRFDINLDARSAILDNATIGPASSSKTPAQSKSTAKRQRAQSRPESVASDSDSGSESSVHSRERSVSQEPDFILAEIIENNPTEDVASSDPTIPPKLLTRLLHQHFSNEKTKVAKDANSIVAKYVDVFVREAIARAAYERAETNNGGRGAGDGFLEVEDLEKMAPQLTMDF
ncbi:hypothetical protein N7509_011646 [Penicillium cosmopolitanum]|uniref:Centromere protein X n=1 Tax=Penicillium cosmopolitanum TaxID=1131564 RepID=A0A9W9SI18_9EURO|nr:uncharacterized protein N7509_011646 [Penicillium cosmopolitanum]KAJ5378527.1 hypothetical protein N7509_011646 [Penicillium cosmopolitanum]